MNTEQTEQRAALFRQRRFLIVTSVAVVAFYWLPIEFKEEAVFSGFGIRITNTDRLVPLLWITWIWAMWRYWQRAYELWSALSDELAEDVFAEDMRIALTYAKKYGNDLAAAGKIDDELPKEARIDGRVKVDRPDPEEIHADEVLGIKSNYFRGYRRTRSGGRVYPLKADLEWTVGITFGRRDEMFTMEISATRAAWFRARAWVYAVLNLPAFSEHFAPFVIALPALGIGITKVVPLALPDCPH